MNLNMDSFDQLGLPSFLVDTIEKLGYKEPTEVQAKSIPKALEGSNIIGLSQTGTGKTAAFLLPIISNLSNGRSKARMPRSLVLCPTRELAAQVMENFENYSTSGKIYVSNIYKIFQTFLSIYDFIKLLLIKNQDHSRDKEHSLINEEINLNERI